MKKGTDMTSYSVDAIKRRMFEDELQNHLMIPTIYADEAHDEKWCAVTEYFEGRIKEIDKQYNTGYTGEEK